MKAKTTYLFKCHGAWSPLWQLSNEKWFEIQSHDYESNMFISCDFGSYDVNSMFSEVLKTMDKAMIKQMGLPKGHGYACVLEPKPYQKTACEKMFADYDLDLAVVSRSYEIFGGNDEPNRERWLSMLGDGAVKVQRSGDSITITRIG